MQIVSLDDPSWTGPSVSGTVYSAPSESSSVFGAGWSFSGSSQLYQLYDYTSGDPQYLGVLQVKGDGTWEYFAYNASTSSAILMEHESKVELELLICHFEEKLIPQIPRDVELFRFL